jgi:predicted permease
VILSGLFGIINPYLIPLFVLMILHPTMVFSTYTLFFRGKKPEPQKLNWRRMVNPVIVSSFVGILIGLTTLRDYIPDLILNILTMVGAMATPLFMLILGGTIYKDFKEQENGPVKYELWEVVKFVIIKNIIFPLVFLGLLILVKPDTTIAFLIILQAAVPPITAIPIFAERMGGNRVIASQFIVGSFLFSLVSIPAMLFLFSIFFPISI